jgi:hypothetical protein
MNVERNAIMKAYKTLESAIKVGQETINNLRTELAAYRDRIEELERLLPPQALDNRYCVRCECYAVENGICLECDVPDSVTSAPDPFDTSFDKQYELAKQIGDRRFGSECKHLHITFGVCVDCQRWVI